MIKNKFSIIFIIYLLLLLSSCGNKPEPINYGHDECEFCRMQITDNRYGCELVTDKEKVYKFDSIECMVEFAMVKNLIGDSNQSLLVTDFSRPETFIDAASAFYVMNDNFRSPMGFNVSAFNGAESGQKFVNDNSGQILNWIDVIELVKQRSI